MSRSVVCDAGAILVVAGSLRGDAPHDAEILALDWASITVSRFLSARHQGNHERAQLEIGLALAAVHEWFPVRTLAAPTLTRAGLEAIDALDSWSALMLAEQLELALFTTSDQVQSTQVEILRPW